MHQLDRLSSKYNSTSIALVKNILREREDDQKHNGSAQIKSYIDVKLRQYVYIHLTDCKVWGIITNGDTIKDLLDL